MHETLSIFNTMFQHTSHPTQLLLAVAARNRSAKRTTNPTKTDTHEGNGTVTAETFGLAVLLDWTTRALKKRPPHPPQLSCCVSAAAAMERATTSSVHLHLWLVGTATGEGTESPRDACELQTHRPDSGELWAQHFRVLHPQRSSLWAQPAWAAGAASTWQLSQRFRSADPRALRQ